MASRFVLTAQVQLQAPTNTRQVVNQIQRQLSGVNVKVNLQGGQQAAKQVNNLNKATKQATTQATKMGKAFGASIRRFGAFTIATRAISLFTNGLANATKEAIDFEREMIKISQVTGKTMAQLKGLENTITGLATSLGVSSKSILSVGRILSQAGIQAKDLNVALTTLAKTSLAPTFDDITQTAEGAVAILAQFGEGVGALERQLGAINRVAGQFAVEAGDLISVVRRTGGVFKAAGGDLEELIALFTSVRATTRESAESIATGLRTIFTRIQRPKTIEFLKQFGVQLTDLNGKFVGPYEAIRQLSGALSGLEQGDIRFVRIAEELGGFRQIGKVIPLLQQFETAERARQAAIEGGNSLNEDAQKAQAALAVQIAKVKEEFLALIRSFTQTSSFNLFVKSSLELASALIKIADALKPLIPLLTAFAAVKFARGAAGFARGIGAGLRGGSPTGFARGGMVPGTGNRDTVPAMLTPGEFVIRKSSVSKLGTGTLAAMNENGYEAGGKVRTGRSFYGIKPSRDSISRIKAGETVGLKSGAGLISGEQIKFKLLNKVGDRDGDKELDIGAAFLQPEGVISNLKSIIPGRKIAAAIASKTGGTKTDAQAQLKSMFGAKGAGESLNLPVNIQSGSLKKGTSRQFKTGWGKALSKFGGEFAKKIIPGGVPKFNHVKFTRSLRQSNIEQAQGGFFESWIAGLSDRPFDNAKINPNDTFDFARGMGSAASLFNLPSQLIADAKRTFSNDSLVSLGNKAANLIMKNVSADIATTALATTKLTGKSLERLQKVSRGGTSVSGSAIAMRGLNKGGGISGSDTVPAMLTPGEFVFNKKAAQSIGYSNLNRMNKQGVQGFAKGGAVQYFNQGTTGSGATKPANLNFKGIDSIAGAASRLSESLSRLSESLAKMGVSTDKQIPILQKFEQELKRGGKVSDALAKTFKDTDISVKNVTKVNKEEIKVIDSAKKAYQSVTKRITDFAATAKSTATNVKNSLKFENIKKSARATVKSLADLNKNPLTRTLRRMAATAAEVIAGDKQKAKASREAAAADKKEAQASKAASGAGGKGRMDATGGLFAISMLSGMAPELDNAEEGMRAVANESKNVVAFLGTLAFAASALGISFTKTKAGINADGVRTSGAKAAGANLLKMAGVAAIAAIAIGQLVKLFDAFSGVQAKAKKAEEQAIKSGSEADIAKAKEAAATASGEKAVNKLAMGAAAAGAAIGFLAFGPVGAVVGGLGALALKSEAVQKALGINADALQDFFATIGLGPTKAQTKAQTAFTIASARAQKILAESAKEAAEELKEIEAGNLTATASLGAGGAASRAAGAVGAQVAAAKDLIKANEDQASQIQSSTIGRIADFFTGRSSSLGQANKKLEQDQIKAGQDFIAGQGARFAAATKEQVVAASAAGGTTSFNDFLSTLDPSIRAVIENTDKMNGNSDEMDKLRKNFENQKKAVVENIKFIKAMNFGLSEVTSGITAYSSSLNNLTAAQQTGFSTAAFAAETLGAAISSAGKNISSAQLGQSLNALEGNLKKFGANAEQITDARALITGLNDLQKSASDALLAVKAGFKGGSTSPEVIKNQLRDAILGSIPDSSPIKQKLIDSFGKLELPPEAIQEFLNTGDVSVILDKAFGPLQEQVQKQLLGPLQEMAKQEKILVGLTQERRKAEQQLISVQKKAIDTQIEAAKSFEFFGGASFTPEKELDARRQQANLVLRDAGIGGLAGGSVADIRGASDQIFNRFSAQQQLQNAAAAGGGGAFGGVEGVDKDRREELKAANEALITFTKQGIEARKKELELINKKNEAEKQALQSLLSGDIESFFDQAIGAAAGSALRSGNAQVAGLFGAGALGQGLQNIQGTVSDSENKRAASIAFGAFGLGDNAARVFTGNTREQEKIKSEGRELALMQSELAGQSADMEQMTVDAKEVVISAANVRLTEISNQVSSAQSALNFSKGGTVYASRGMFIPRGTDTVPAMLTPGEFVVNRAAVQRGNNLQILRSMNSNSAPIQATQALSSGGPVRYRANGSTGPEGPGGIDFSKFEEMVNKFQEVTDKLGNVNIKHMFEKLGTLDINHMFNGNMQQAFKDEILAEAGNMMSRSKFNSDGSITTSDRSVLG